MTDRNIPLNVFHFDCFWMREYEWCNFDWDKEKFPEPENMLARLKAKGLKICVWINPYIAHMSPLFEEAKQKGYLIKNKTGGVWQWDIWQAGMGIVDFTNPGVCFVFETITRGTAFISPTIPEGIKSIATTIMTPIAISP